MASLFVPTLESVAKRAVAIPITLIMYASVNCFIYGCVTNEEEGEGGLHHANAKYTEECDLLFPWDMQLPEG